MGMEISDAAAVWSSLQALLAEYSWVSRLIALTAFILLMVTVVAWLYSGEIQNTEIGPLAIRGSDSVDRGQFFGPKPVVANNIDGKRALCTFWIKYTTRGGRQVHRRIWEGRLRFGQVGRRYTFAPGDLIGFWNQPRHDTIQACLMKAGLPADPPSMFAERTEPFDIRAWIKDVDYEVASLSKEEFEAIRRSHAAVIESAISEYEGRKVRAAGNERRTRALHESRFYKAMPDLSQDARVYMRMRFDIHPWYALTKHPDREVKTTAWLTVLTSVFAMLMQIMYNGLK